MKTFETVESAKTARSYTNVPRSMGLIIMTNGKFSLTDLGKQLLKDATREKLLEVLESNIIGITEILKALEKESLTERQIWTYLNESLNLGWKTYAQTRFRLLWLQNASAIRKLENGQYQLAS